ncbi:MAG: TolC family protein, partial [Leptospiraceae bacterium]|nr:TolC family protein [Leptospiraceae bacterium]
MKFLFLVIFIFTVQIYGESKSESILHKLINNHPEVLSYRKTIRSKIAGSQHSDTYPDPKFGVSFKNYPYKGNPFQFESGKSESISMSGVEYMVSQEIPYPGKLGREREVRKLDTLEFSYITEEKINFFLAQLFNILVQLKFTEIKYTQAEAISKISNSIKRVSNAEYTIGNKSLSSSSYNHIDQVEAKELMIDLESKKNSLEANLNYFSIDNSITKEDLLNIKFENYLNSIFNELKNKKVSVENIPGFNIQRVVFEKSVKEMNLKEI